MPTLKKAFGSGLSLSVRFSAAAQPSARCSPEDFSNISWIISFGEIKEKKKCTNAPIDLPELDEEGTRISLTIVDTPGFGDQIDNEAR